MFALVKDGRLVDIVNEFEAARQIAKEEGLSIRPASDETASMFEDEVVDAAFRADIAREAVHRGGRKIASIALRYGKSVERAEAYAKACRESGSVSNREWHPRYWARIVSVRAQFDAPKIG